MDISVSGGREGSQPRGGEGENRKQKTQGGTGAQGPKHVRVDVRKVLAFAEMYTWILDVVYILTSKEHEPGLVL